LWREDGVDFVDQVFGGHEFEGDDVACCMDSLVCSRSPLKLALHLVSLNI
jgi:hypothetical protein